MTCRISSEAGRPLRTTLVFTVKLGVMLLLPQSPIAPQAGPLGGFDAYAIVGLMPDQRLGVAVLTNLDHSELRHALMYTVFDRYLPRDKVSHDWSAEMLTLYRVLDDTAAAERRKKEAKRVMNTHPSLPIDSYVGAYSDSLFGTATVRLDRSRLTLQAGTHTADLEHWQYAIFRVNWRDPFWDSDYASFTLDPDGTVAEMRIVGAPRRYRRNTSPTQPR